MKKLLLPLVTLFFVLCMNTSYAYTDYSQRYADRSDPAVELQRTVAELEKFNQSADAAHPGMLKAFLEKKVFPHFDFDSMSRWITGPYARYMSPEDKKEFQAALRETFLSALVRHLGGFDSGSTELRFHRTQYRANNEAIVRVSVYRQQKRPARLEFGMENTAGKWRIVDVKANGTSAVLYYRQHFIAKLRSYSEQQPSRSSQTPR
jgi:phospholipid transport system substrate-binding protein